MQLRLKPYHKNNYPIKGLLIRGTSVQEWMTAICRLPINLQQVESYAVPGSEANTLYGCVLYFGNSPMPREINNHQYLQYAGDKLLVPTQAIYLPAVEQAELKNLAPGKKILLHPAVGCVMLDEPLDWSALLAFKEPAPIAIKKPIAGVFVPSEVNSFTLELNDEKLLQTLMNSPSEKERMDALPFDMKKLMAGNKREMEKYLKYLEANPDKALDMALPLDVLGSFRGDNNGRFNFSGSWLQRLFNSSNDSSNRRQHSSSNSSTGNYWWIGLILVTVIKLMTCNPTTKEPTVQPKSIVVKETRQSVLDSHFSSIMSSKRFALLQQLKQKSDSGSKLGSFYRVEYKKLAAFGTAIKDSLTNLYTVRANKQADSVVREWKKTALDSIKRNVDASNLRYHLQKAINDKRANTYREYALYYGLMKDDTKTLETVEITSPATEKKKALKGNVSTVSIVLLSLTLVVISLLVVVVKAPGSSINIGQEELSFGSIAFALLILIGSLAYLLLPVVEMYGFGWLTIAICLILILLLYRLFAKGATFLK